NGFLGDCGPSCLEIIHKLPLCSSGAILHLSDDHRYRTRGYLAWSTRPRAMDSCLVLLPLTNTVISGLLSAPEYKPHALNFLQIIILNIYRPQVPTATLKQINFTQAKMNIKSNTIVMHIISFASYDKCTVALREHSCKSQSEARTLD